MRQILLDVSTGAWGGVDDVELLSAIILPFTQSLEPIVLGENGNTFVLLNVSKHILFNYVH